jgi:ketose-bisphosphate aldolase
MGIASPGEMMERGSAEIIKAARAAGIAIPAFNVPYLPMVKPLIDAVREADAFAFLEVARPEWEKFGAKSIEEVAREYGRWADRERTRLHLDHIPVIDEDGKSVDWRPLFQRAIAVHFDSLMIDGSRLPLEENIRATREATTMAHAAGKPCEAELGAVMGHEEGPLPPYEELFRTGRGFTDPTEAARFARETGCDWLSVAIGNIHGAISRARRDERKVEARLSLERLEAIEKTAAVPLVLHGGSGIRPEDVRASFRLGIAKINVGIDVRQVWEKTVGEGEARAARAVYERALSLLRDTYGLEGSRARLQET